MFLWSKKLKNFIDAYFIFLLLGKLNTNDPNETMY